MTYEELHRDTEISERWNTIDNPGTHHTEKAFSNFLEHHGEERQVLNCAVPLSRALTLTDRQMPDGLGFQDCLTASVMGKFPEGLKEWNYEPCVKSVPQLPQMAVIPPERASLSLLPWFEPQGHGAWLGINARHLRNHYHLWQDLKPKVLQGVTTTMVLAMPQIGYALTPHIQMEKAFLFFGALGRALGPVQLFPAKYLYPDADLDTLGDAPAPIFADVLPATGGFAFPTVDCEPDPWRTLARFGQSDRYYGYPFHEATNSTEDFNVQGCEKGTMLLPNGQRVFARQSDSRVHATLDASLNEELLLDRDNFERETCLLRGSVTHDGLPYQLPVEMQCMVYAVIVTHWRMELDKPGDLTSYTVATEHAAIRGFNYYQRVEPYYYKFMTLIRELSKNPDFKTYPVCTHLTDSWLGGNLQIANQLSNSEEELGPTPMRAYYRQQLDWLAGVTNLMNHTAFRTKNESAGVVSRSGKEIEQQLSLEGLAMHQMHRMLRFDSHLFKRALKCASLWPDSHPGWAELDKCALTESLPRL
jgi:hypothetical protein